VNQSQCHIRLPFAELDGGAVRLHDRMGQASYDRSGTELLARGLFVDLPPWGCHVFELGVG